MIQKKGSCHGSLFFCLKNIKLSSVAVDLEDIPLSLFFSDKTHHQLSEEKWHLWFNLFVQAQQLQPQQYENQHAHDEDVRTPVNVDV